MHRTIMTVTCAIGLVLFMGPVGCQKPAEKTPTDNTGGTDKKTPGKNGDEHHEEGPHKGLVIELGKDHKHHAELVHDEKAHKVTIYILGEEVKGKFEKMVPIEAKEVVINLKHDGKAEQFKLKAMPDKGDPEGKSSRFVSEEKELSEDLDAKGVEASLVVTIEGKSYTGKIEHEHGKKPHKH